MNESHAYQTEVAFSKAHPKAIDFTQGEYEGAKDEFDAIATRYGYSLAGFRLGRAVFTTKPQNKGNSA